MIDVATWNRRADARHVVFFKPGRSMPEFGFSRTLPAFFVRFRPCRIKLGCGGNTAIAALLKQLLAQLRAHILQQIEQLLCALGSRLVAHCQGERGCTCCEKEE